VKWSLSLGLALTALVAAVVAALAPPDQLEATYQWQPSTDGNSSPLLLVEGEPDQMNLVIPCSKLTQPNQKLFASSGRPEKFPALVITATGAGARLDIPANLKEPTNYVPIATTAAISPTCQLRLEYEQSTRLLSVALLEPAGGKVLEAFDYQMPAEGGFEVTGLHWAPEVDAAGVNATVVTSPFVTVRPSALQLVAIAVFLIAAGVAIYIAYKERKKLTMRDQITPQSNWRGLWGKLRPYPSEVMMFLFSLFIMIVDIPRYDDGWNLWVGEQFVSSGTFSNLVFGQNLSTHLDLPFFLVLGVLIEPFNSVLGMRLLPLFLAVFIWVVLRRFILPRFNLSKPAIVTAWVVTAAYILAWGSTLRGEPFVIACTVAVIALIATWPGAPSFGATRTGFLIAILGLGLASHQTALVAVAAAVAAIPLVVRALRSRPSALLTASAWGIGVSLLLVFANSNVSRTLEGLGRYQARTEWHSYGPLDEWRRMFDFVSYWNAAASYLTIALFIAGLITLLLVCGYYLTLIDRTTPKTLVVASAILLPAGLLFTGSKWNWHYAVLLPTAVLGWALLTQAVVSPVVRGRVLMVATPVLAVIAAGLAAAWGLHEGRPWSDIIAFAFQRSVLSKEAETNWPLLFGPKSAWWVWVGLALGVAALTYAIARARREPARYAAAWSVAFATLSMTVVVASFQLSPPIKDAIKNPREWTFVYQSVMGLVDPNVRCGAPSATFLTASDEAGAAGESVQQILDKTGGAMALPPQVVMAAPCSRAPEIRDGVQEIPSMIMGRLDLAGARLEAETTAVPWVCNSFPTERSAEYLCFSRLIKIGEPLTASKVRWRQWGT